MSKSLGNVVDPIELLERYPLEAVKTYMLVFGPAIKDSNFDETKLAKFYNNFVNVVVNCLSRLFGKKILKDLSGTVSMKEA